MIVEKIILEAKSGTPLTIEQINQVKPTNSKVTAVRFDGKHITPNGASYRRVVCVCECGGVFSAILSSITQGKTLSCGCIRMKYLKSSGYSIKDINAKKPQNSRLIAVSFAPSRINPNGQPSKMVNAKCSCGVEKEIRQCDVVSGHTISCGCYEAEVLLKRNTKYSQNIPKLWHCWNDMVRRCYDQTSSSYENYGLKGVVVCDEWKTNYQSFLDWSLNNGWKPGLHIDKDINGNGLLYSPSTCCFVTPTVNLNNTKRNVKFNYVGQWLTLAEIARKLNINSERLYRRVVTMSIPLEKATLLDTIILSKWDVKKYRQQ